MKFRKRPVEVTAIRWDGNLSTLIDISAIAGKRTVARTEEGTLTIDTLEGVMTGNIGDWIIQGVKGEIYPCKPDIFDATYEQVRA